MKKQTIWHEPFARIVRGVLFCGGLSISTVMASEISTADTNRLTRLVRQDCGSCHGLRLAGGLGPSLLPSALQGKPTSFLVSAILDGRKGTPMPPWRGMLSEKEATWIVERLLTEFPKE